MTSSNQISILSLWAAGTNAVPLLPHTHPIQRRDESTTPIIIVGILVISPAILAILFAVYKMCCSLRRLAYRIAHGEKMPTQEELLECWATYGQDGRNVVLPPAPATQAELMRCWGVGPSGNGWLMREEARRRWAADYANTPRSYGLGRYN